VVGQLQDRAALKELGDDALPVRPLSRLALTGQQDREHAVLEPEADRVVVLILVFLGRLGEHREGDRAQGDRANGIRGAIACMALSRTSRSSRR
jgi:hypothetical protein